MKRQKVYGQGMLQGSEISGRLVQMGPAVVESGMDGYADHDVRSLSDEPLQVVLDESVGLSGERLVRLLIHYLQVIEEEVRMLKDEASFLKEQMEDVQNRISTLEKTKDSQKGE